jgi:hypothetical protein
MSCLGNDVRLLVMLPKPDKGIEGYHHFGEG